MLVNKGVALEEPVVSSSDEYSESLLRAVDGNHCGATCWLLVGNRDSSCLDLVGFFFFNVRNLPLIVLSIGDQFGCLRWY